jgi:hypothetical protein
MADMVPVGLEGPWYGKKHFGFRISEKGAEVTGQISNPHDKLIMQLLGEPENAADFVANNLPAEIVAHLDLSTLEVVQVSPFDTFLRYLPSIPSFDTSGQVHRRPVRTIRGRFAFLGRH